MGGTGLFNMDALSMLDQQAVPLAFKIDELKGLTSELKAEK